MALQVTNGVTGNALRAARARSHLHTPWKSGVVERAREPKSGQVLALWKPPALPLAKRVDQIGPPGRDGEVLQLH